MAIAPVVLALTLAATATEPWQLSQPAVGAQLEGYAGATSVNHGEPIDIHVRTDAPHTVRWELYRMGYYAGAGSLRIATGGPVAVTAQPLPTTDRVTGLVECQWPTSFVIQTQPTWQSGMYLLKLLRDDGPQRYVVFVVRADERKGAAMVQIPFTTFQAYNAWGGESLYTDSIGLSGAHAKVVSFNRPFADGSGSGEYFYYVHNFVLWAEARGYDLVYVTNVDLDRDPSLVRGQKLFLAVGHDEYWSRPARVAVESALASGVNLAFLAGDTCFWQIRLEAGRRRQVCYKDEAPEEDPLAATDRITVRWRDPPVVQPENALAGVMSEAWGLINQPFVVRTPGAWPFAGTGLVAGDALLGVAGYEIDRVFTNGQGPAGLTSLARSPVIAHDGTPNWHDSTLYTAPSGAFVFAAGGVAWSLGLSHPNFADLRVQRITDNVFQRAGLTPTSAGDTFGAHLPRLIDRTEQAASVTTVAGAAFQEGLVNGPVAAARFRRPVGVAVDGAGNVFVTDTGNHVVRMISGGAVSTVAGTGQPGRGEGPGATTALRAPQGIAVGPDGSLYVADTGNHRIVRLARDGQWTVSTIAGPLNGAQGLADGVGTVARFRSPTGVAFAGTDLYVIDCFNHRLARVTPDRRVTTVIGLLGQGRNDGPANQARLHRPTGLAVGGGAVWIVDSGNRSIRRVALDASFTTSTAAGREPGGWADGPVGSALFMPLLGAVYSGGALRVTDTGNERIRSFSGGRVRTYAGRGGHGAQDGAADQATFSLPTGVAALPNGDLYVVDQGSSLVRRILASPGGNPTPGPLPRITGGPFSAQAAPLDVYLDATRSTVNGPGNWIARFQWDLGDGARSEQAFLTHRYASAGRYTVTLTATDGAGVSAYITQAITIGPHN